MRQKKYVKISVDMFENRKLKLIENMPNRDMIEIIWMKLLVEATKLNNGGLIYLEEDIPYTMEMLSVVLGRSSEDIAIALKVLRDLKMIEMDENSVIKVLSWSNHQEPRRKKKSVENVENTNKEEKLDSISENKEETPIALDTLKNNKSILEQKSINNEDGKGIVNIKGRKRKGRGRRKKVEEEIFAIGSIDEDIDGGTEEECFSNGDYIPEGKIIQSFKFD